MGPEVVDAALTFFRSDPAIVGLTTGVILETGYALGDLKIDPARIPINLISGALLGLVAAGGLEYLGLQSAEVVNGAMVLGYVLPSIGRLISNISTHNQSAEKIIPPAVATGLTIAMGAANLAVGSLDIYHFASIDRFSAAMHFFGSALSQFGKQLPNLGGKIQELTK
jgi:hypothetical protein